MRTGSSRLATTLHCDAWLSVWVCSEQGMSLHHENFDRFSGTSCAIVDSLILATMRMYTRHICAACLLLQQSSESRAFCVRTAAATVSSSILQPSRVATTGYSNTYSVYSTAVQLQHHTRQTSAIAIYCGEIIWIVSLHLDFKPVHSRCLP